jgi:hypothetical protein
MIYCTASFAAFYFPFCFGAVLVFLVAIVRYTMARKAARNIYIPNEVISRWSLGAFALAVLIYCAFLAINTGMDFPYSMVTEACMHQERPG